VDFDDAKVERGVHTPTVLGVRATGFRGRVAHAVCDTPRSGAEGSRGIKEIKKYYKYSIAQFFICQQILLIDNFKKEQRRKEIRETTSIMPFKHQ
jgi:hypothetical protein